jgi:tight adherence protein C
MNSLWMISPFLLAVSGSLVFFSRQDDITEIRHSFRKRIVKIKDTSGVRGRLKALGEEDGYEKFRMLQVTRSLSCSILLFLLTYILENSIFVSTIAMSIAAIGIFLLEDRRLSSRVRRQRIHIEAEFASSIEILTLALSAGVTPLSAMIGISQRSSGLFSKQLEMVVDSVKSGKSFQVSLDEMGRRIQSAQIRRFTDALVTAIARGAPLIELLHIHAAEARAAQKNIIMDKAGKAEMSMMVPVVFLILPISILFALWPSLTHLNLFAS